MVLPLKLQKLKALPIWVLFSTEANDARDEDRLWFMLRKRDGELPEETPTGFNARMTLHPELSIWQSRVSPKGESSSVKYGVVFKWEKIEYEHRTVDNMTEFTFSVKPNAYTAARSRNTDQVSHQADQIAFACSDPNTFPHARKFGSMTACVFDSQTKYIKMNLDAISAESKAAKERLNGQERECCTVRYHAYRGFIVAQIEPVQAATGAWDISSGQRIRLTNPEPDADDGEDVLGVRVESELPFSGSVVGIVEDRVDVQKYDGLVQEGIHVTVDFADPTADRHADAARKLSTTSKGRKRSCLQDLP
ncbi:MAG: hypothetical protein M1819_002405 [Sarea resinae]|nr:MAG: hypothetical protein M1819_002405 [Sarea resinae]